VVDLVTSTEVQRIQGLRQQALAQVNENEMVIQELGFLEEDAKVYKLIGPVLVQQDLVEVKANVSKRVDYIKGDVTRIDQQLAGAEKKIEEQRAKIAKMQQQGGVAKK